jgi:carboxylesterase type B
VQKALEWVQANIWAWGGDPEQVTVFGQSAGAILTSLLYLQPDIDLFKQAIMHSGAQSTAPLTQTDVNWQGPYDALVQFAGCDVTAVQNNTATGSTGSNSTNVSGSGGEVNATNPIANGTNSTGFSSSFECLKALPAQELFVAQERTRNLPQYQLSFIFAPSVDGDLIPDSPHNLLASGQFARKPYITGNVKDEWVPWCCCGDEGN